MVNSRPMRFLGRALTDRVRRVTDNSWGHSQDQCRDRLDHLPPYLEHRSILISGTRSLGFPVTPSVEYPFNEPAT